MCKPTGAGDQAPTSVEAINFGKRLGGVDVEDVHGVFLVVGPVAHPILAPVGTPLTRKGIAKRCPDAVGIIGQGTEDELDACGGDRFWKLLR